MHRLRQRLQYRHWVGVLLLALFSLVCSACSSGGPSPVESPINSHVVERRTVGDWCAGHKYDELFKKAARRANPAEWRTIWCRYKAMGLVESNLDPTARSPVGAYGITQIMFQTWQDLQKSNYCLGGFNDPWCQILQGTRYLKWQMDRWHFKRGSDCRWELGLAGYNAGFGTILSAQRQSGMQLCGVVDWPGVPQETRDYVLRNRALWVTKMEELH